MRQAPIENLVPALDENEIASGRKSLSFRVITFHVHHGLIVAFADKLLGGGNGLLAQFPKKQHHAILSFLFNPFVAIEILVGALLEQPPLLVGGFLVALIIPFLAPLHRVLLITEFPLGQAHHVDLEFRLRGGSHSLRTTAVHALDEAAVTRCPCVVFLRHRLEALAHRRVPLGVLVKEFSRDHATVRVTRGNANGPFKKVPFLHYDALPAATWLVLRLEREETDGRGAKDAEFDKLVRLDRVLRDAVEKTP